jgi:hypothetical protein
VRIFKIVRLRYFDAPAGDVDPPRYRDASIAHIFAHFHPRISLSHAVVWVPLGEIESRDVDESVLRLARKTSSLCPAFGSPETRPL